MRRQLESSMPCNKSSQKCGREPLSDKERERRRKQSEASRLGEDAGPQPLRYLPNGRHNRKNAAIRIGLRPATLAQWAWLGKGPPFYMVGGRAQYEPADLDAFAVKQLPNEKPKAPAISQELTAWSGKAKRPT